MDLQAKKGNQELKALLFNIAEQYVSAGLQIVCVHSAWCDNTIKRGKAPTHMGWQKESLSWRELQKELERVWSREGGANIGLKTGKTSKIVCVDVDVKSGGMGWFLEHQIHLGSPIIERTPNGGLHLYYRYPSALLHSDSELKTRSSGSRIFKGIDILADGAGQVVTYPSIHASQEGQYVFDNGLSLLDVEHEADELPRWIVDEMLLKQESYERKESKSSHGADVLDNPLDLEAARLAVQSLPAAVQGDGGDMQTLKAAMICRDYGLSEDAVYRILKDEYNPRCSPPWDLKDLWAKVKNAFKYSRMNQGNQSIATAFSDEPTIPEEPQRALMYSKKNAIHSAHVFMERNKRFVDCFDGQFVHYDKENHRWAVVSDSFMDSIIYRDIGEFCNHGELLKTMKVGHISDIRKGVKFHLNKGHLIPDVSFKGREGNNYVTLKNGILDLSNGELLSHTEDWFCFHSVDVDYDPDARCPEFMKFLDSIWDGDSDLIESLRLWMGYCLLSVANFQKFAIFKGASRAGKSTLVSVLEAMLGHDNCASTSLSLIGSDFGLESLMGKKLVVFQDADRASPDRMGVATERIKSLASNDPVGINRKGQSVVNQRMNTKVAFVCNKLPPFLNDENALTNRMIVFPFWKSFQGQEDLGLSDRLHGEIQGILNWGLVGARRLLRGEKLFTAPKGLEALEDITQQLDSVRGFIAECVKVTGFENHTVGTRALWDAYKEWCKDSGRLAKNKQRFFMELSGINPFK
ncbi:hypothetical protein EBZ39_14530, partial [bacterium]|nr:hypothetical protein [bacterium]